MLPRYLKECPEGEPFTPRPLRSQLEVNALLLEELALVEVQGRVPATGAGSVPSASPSTKM
jgi:hypothetical protein